MVIYVDLFHVKITFSSSSCFSSLPLYSIPALILLVSTKEILSVLSQKVNAVFFLTILESDQITFKLKHALNGKIQIKQKITLGIEKNINNIFGLFMHIKSNNTGLI